MAHYNLQCLDNPAVNTFASRFTLPLWNYIVPPPKPEDKPYIGGYVFNRLPLSRFLAEYPLAVGDVLELFWLRRRIRFVGVQINIMTPVIGLTITPITNSGILFDTIDASVESNNTYAVNGGLLDINTDLKQHSVVIDNPDYLGILLGGSVAGIASLNMKVTLSTSEEFAVTDPTNAPDQA